MLVPKVLGEGPVTMGWDHWETFYTMSRSYATAGTIIFSKAVEKNPVPGMEYPWLFCWRHAFELALKAVIKKFSSSANMAQHGYHDLLRLYDSAKKCARDLESEELLDVLRELAKLDPDGMALRYPALKDGTNAMNFCSLRCPKEWQGKFKKAFDCIAPFGVELPNGIYPPGVRGR